jgi:2-polyprenyl-6-methoxyphenol hydroxylase-like FAD-dependent oxidoreductase
MSTGTPLWLYEESAFVIGADGANSAVRESMARTSPKNKFSITRFEDKNVRLYRTIPLYFPEGSTKNWRKDLNWSVRLKSDINMDALPTKEGVYLGVVLYRPWDDRINLLKTKDDVKLFFTTYFPMFSQCMKSEDMETFAKKKPSTFSPFSYAGPDLHKGKTAVILGDCAHTVKPFFGLGVNSAFEDVVTLGRCLDAQQQSIPKALVSYSRSRGPESKALVTMSRQLDGGLLTFLLPLIVDSILHQFLPFIFSPNTIAAMQDEKKTYVGVARRKKIDRVLQLVFGTAIAAGIAKGFSLLAKCAQSLLRFRFGVGA